MLQVRSLYQNPTVATGVRVRMLLHPAFAFRDTNATTTTTTTTTTKRAFSLFGGKTANNNSNKSTDASSARNVVERDIGNATAELDIAFAYQRNAEWNAAFTMKEVPFQAQIYYISPHTGAKVVRVISSVLPATSAREAAEAQLNGSVVSVCAVQRCATLARDYGADSALVELHAVESLLTRCANNDERCEEAYVYRQESAPLDAALRKAAVAKSKLNKVGNKSSCDDDALAATLLKMRGAPRRQFQSGASKKVETRIKRRDEQEHVARAGVEAMY